MYEVKIESGIKIPARRTRQKEIHFERMRIMDSFFIPAKPNESLIKTQARIASRCHQWVKRTESSFKFQSRCMENENGVRVWRVK